MDWGFWQKLGSFVLGTAVVVGVVYRALAYHQKRRELKEAKRREEQDQQKQVRAVASQPHACYLPPKNKYFTGRKEQLQSLRNQFTTRTSNRVVLTQAVAGLGGLGKTQLALEYAYEQRPRYEVVWWLRAEQENTLLEDYANLAAELGLPVTPDADRRQVMHAVWAKLQTVRLWLLVFDNAEHAKSIEAFVPTQGNGDVLITSRDREWTGHADRLDIDKFEPKESVEFLVKRTGLSDRDGAAAIAEAVDHLPLALEQAAAYIAGHGLSFQKYLADYRERQTEMHERGTALFYQSTVAATWLINFEALEKKNPAAAELFNLCAFLAPDRIPLKTIRKQAEFLPEALAKACGDDLVVNDLVADLTRHSLVKHDDGLLYIHRLVQAVARNRLSKNDQRAWVERAVKVLNAAFPYEPNNLATWAPSAELLPHVLAVNERAEEIEFTDEPLGRLLNEAGRFLTLRGAFTTSLVLHEKAFSLAKKNLESTDPEAARRADRLATVLQQLGRYEDAKLLFKQALEIAASALQSDDRGIAVYANNLGSVLQALGDLNGAKAHFERALPIFEKALGKEHPNVASCANNLGSVLQDLGDLPEAKVHIERALRIGEKTLGNEHPDVATWANNLGMVLNDLGDLNGAKAHLERALRIDEKVLGLDHPNVARDANNLGSVLQDLGDLPRAKAHLERAVRILKKTLGDEHPKTQWARANLQDVEEQIKKKA
jgi:tetratricopeptide (TPR) repeat protein